LFTISADPVQLDRVFGNIILNAIQAMPEGGRLVVKTARLSLRAEPQAEGSPKSSEVSGKPPRSEGVAVSFADTGVGIPEENLARILAAFHHQGEGDWAGAAARQGPGGRTWRHHRGGEPIGSFDYALRLRSGQAQDR